MSTEKMNEPQDRQSRERGFWSVFRCYHLGWVLLSMVVAVVLVQLAGGGWGATIMLPLIVGALVFRSMLVADYKKRNQ